MKRGEVKRREKVFMEKQSFSEKQTWSTWEELLLAYAVYRYGMESWDSVSTELQKRSTTTSSHLTAVDKSTLTSNAISTKTPVNITSFTEDEADKLPLVNSNSIPILSLEFPFVWLLRKSDGKCLGLEI